jgi:hypothetical protein
MIKAEGWGQIWVLLNPQTLEWWLHWICEESL